MLLQKRLQKFGDLGAALATADQHHRLAGVVVDRPDAVALFGLGWGLDHHLLALGAPHRLEGRHPAQVELVCVVEMIPRLQPVAGFFDRLFLRAYSGSGLVMVCWGRLKTMPSAFRCTRTVSYC